MPEDLLEAFLSPSLKTRHRFEIWSIKSTEQMLQSSWRKFGKLKNSERIFSPLSFFFFFFLNWNCNRVTSLTFPCCTSFIDCSWQAWLRTQSSRTCSFPRWRSDNHRCRSGTAVKRTELGGSSSSSATAVRWNLCRAKTWTSSLLPWAPHQLPPSGHCFLETLHLGTKFAEQGDASCTRHVAVYLWLSLKPPYKSSESALQPQTNAQNFTLRSGQVLQLSRSSGCPG